MKICPILLAGATGTMAGETGCVKERCEWWTYSPKSEYAQCAVMSLLRFLEEIAQE